MNEMVNKKIVIAGGTGFIGEALIDHFSVGNDLTVLTRGVSKLQTNRFDVGRDQRADDRAKFVLWDAVTQGPWTAALEGADIVINMCGRTVNCRYTKKNKAEILNSRTQPTLALGEAMRHATVAPRLWINASSATIYRDARDRPQDEFNGEIQNDFSVQVCKAWEKSFFGTQASHTRKVALRMAVTLGSGGVIVPYFYLLKFGLGGKHGDGRQMYSWIHIVDTCRIIDWIEANTDVEGVYNCSSPYPVTNDVFMQTFRKLTGRKLGLPAPAWMLKIGAAIIGTETELLLKSRWVLPTKLLQAGFIFQYPQLADAISEIVGNTKREQYHLF